MSEKEVAGPSFGRRLFAEFLGTFVLVWFGCGAVMNAKYTGAMVGLGQVTMTWVLGGALAVYTCGSISGGHLNPAVSLAFALVRPRDFPIYYLIPYAVAQTTGAFCASAVNYYLFKDSILRFENKNGFVRDEDGHSYANAFGCYWSDDVEDATHAFVLEIIGTAMLTFTVFTVTNKSNNVPAYLVPAIVGIAIGSIIAIIGSMSGGAINPARDIGPRLFTLVVGWGTYSFDKMWPYTAGPFAGGVLGAVLSDLLVRP